MHVVLKVSGVKKNKNNTDRLADYFFANFTKISFFVPYKDFVEAVKHVSS